MNEELKCKIRTYFENKKEEMLSLLSKLVSFPSIANVTNDSTKPYGEECFAILNYFLEKAANEGFDVKNYDNHVGAVNLRNDKLEQSIALISHLDVVPAEGDWDYEPFRMQIVNNYAIGRGVSDNKIAAVAVYYMLKCIKELNIKTKHNITLLLGTAEEIGMYDVDYFTKNYQSPLFTLVPDASYPCGRGEFGRVNFNLSTRLSEDFLELKSNEAYNLVPDYAYAKLKIVLPEINNESIKVTVDNGVSLVEAYGKAIHAAKAPLGVNAIKVLFNHLLNLKQIKDADKKALGALQEANIDALGTGLGINYSDDLSGETVCSGNIMWYEDNIVSLGFDIRYAVTEKFDFINEKIKTFAKNKDLIYTLVKEEKPYYLPMDNKAVSTVLSVYNKISKQNIDFIPIMKGGTYASHIPNALSIGMSYLSEEEKAKQNLDFLREGHGGAHQKDEVLSINGFMAGINLLFEILLELDERL